MWTLIWKPWCSWCWGCLWPCTDNLTRCFQIRNPPFNHLTTAVHYWSLNVNGSSAKNGGINLTIGASSEITVAISIRQYIGIWKLAARVYYDLKAKSSIKACHRLLHGIGVGTVWFEKRGAFKLKHKIKNNCSACSAAQTCCMGSGLGL